MVLLQGILFVPIAWTIVKILDNSTDNPLKEQFLKLSIDAIGSWFLYAKGGSHTLKQ